MRNNIIRVGLSVSLFLGAGFFAVRDTDTAQLRYALSNLSLAYVAIPMLAITASSLFASLRVRSIARALGYPLSLRDSVAVLSLGQLGGVLFFQIFGQLLARGSYLTRRNVPFAGTLIITGQERIVAALVSLCLAVIGAFYLFRQVTFDLASGGLDLIRIVVGLTFATSVVAIVWRVQVRHAVAQITKVGVASTIRAVAFSLAVQMTMMVAYVSAAKTLAPSITMIDLAAAATLVMFAASIPISFAGWGVREMSAVGALGAIGMSAPAALTVAVTVGALSVVCAGLLAAGSVTRAKTDQAKPVQSIPIAGVLHEAVLSAVLPILIAYLVFFQIHIPTYTTQINFNVADPFAIICGVLFILQIGRTGPPKWRISGINLHVLACTAVISLGLFVGAAQIGWTTWAVVNKFLGWFVLLSYGAAGAMAARVDLDKTLLTFAAAGCSVVIFAVSDRLLAQVGFVTALLFNGFAQNNNALAFLCLMMLAVGLIIQRHNLIVVTLATMAIILTGSRAGLGAAVSVLLTASIIIPRIWQTAVVSIAVAALLTYCLNSIGSASSIAGMLSIERGGELEHWTTVRDGFAMFRNHPIFGAGLGVFIDQWRRADPLIIHNSLVWLLAEFGIIGALAFFVPTIRIVRQELKRFRSNDTAGYLLILIIAGFGAMSLFHELLYQRAMWFLLGAALICIDRPNSLSALPKQTI